MQYETSITHQEQLKKGLTVEWWREHQEPRPDDCWSVVCYSDGSRWLFDNGQPEQLTLLGEVSDGLNKAEILEGETGALIALYQEEPQAFGDWHDWIESMADADKDEAMALIGAKYVASQTFEIFGDPSEMKFDKLKEAQEYCGALARILGNHDQMFPKVLNDPEWRVIEPAEHIGFSKETEFCKLLWERAQSIDPDDEENTCRKIRTIYLVEWIRDQACEIRLELHEP